MAQWQPQPQPQQQQQQQQRHFMMFQSIICFMMLRLLGIRHEESSSDFTCLEFLIQSSDDGRDHPEQSHSAWNHTQYPLIGGKWSTIDSIIR